MKLLLGQPEKAKQYIQTPCPFPHSIPAGLWNAQLLQADIGGTLLASSSKEKTILFFHKLKVILRKKSRAQQKDAGEG